MAIGSRGRRRCVLAAAAAACEGIIHGCQRLSRNRQRHPGEVRRYEYQVHSAYRGDKKDGGFSHQTKRSDNDIHA